VVIAATIPATVPVAATIVTITGTGLVVTP
jgi:hypothetical protein